LSEVAFDFAGRDVAEELPRLPLRPLMPPGSLTIMKMAAAVLPITPLDEAGRYRARHFRS
jgi:hypothetical protein